MSSIVGCPKGLGLRLGAKSRGLRGVSNGARTVMAADRPLWLPGSTPPAHLDGSMAGDFGWDPLGLGANPEAMKWFRESELQHSRWAMLGVAGILGQVGGWVERTCSKRFETAMVIYSGRDDYWEAGDVVFKSARFFLIPQG